MSSYLLVIFLLQPMYHTTLAHDPEGILGSLTAVLTVYSGVLAGHIVVMLKSSRGSTLGALSVLTVVSVRSVLYPISIN